MLNLLLGIIIGIPIGALLFISVDWAWGAWNWRRGKPKIYHFQSEADDLLRQLLNQQMELPLDKTKDQELN